MGGKQFILLLPFLIFDLGHVQYICFFQYRWTAIYPNSFYPVTGLPVKRTAVTRPLVPVHTFLCTCTMLILMYSTVDQIYEFYSTLTHQAVGQFYLKFRLCTSTFGFGMTLQTELAGLHNKFYSALRVSSLGDFYRLCFNYFGFSLILEGIQYRSGNLIQTWCWRASSGCSSPRAWPPPPPPPLPP